MCLKPGQFVRRTAPHIGGPAPVTALTPECGRALRSERGEAERGPEGILVGYAVARRQGPRRLAGVDQDLCERGAVTAVDPRRERVDVLVPLDATGVRDAEAPRHGRQVCS